MKIKHGEIPAEGVLLEEEFFDLLEESESDEFLQNLMIGLGEVIEIYRAEKLDYLLKKSIVIPIQSLSLVAGMAGSCYALFILSKEENVHYQLSIFLVMGFLVLAMMSCVLLEAHLVGEEEEKINVENDLLTLLQNPKLTTLSQADDFSLAELIRAHEQFKSKKKPPKIKRAYNADLKRRRSRLTNDDSNNSEQHLDDFFSSNVDLVSTE